MANGGAAVAVQWRGGRRAHLGVGKALETVGKEAEVLVVDWEIADPACSAPVMARWRASRMAVAESRLSGRARFDGGSTTTQRRTAPARNTRPRAGMA
jgi:hypothetical protein